MLICQLHVGDKLLWCPCEYDLPCDYTLECTVTEVYDDYVIAHSVDNDLLYITDDTVNEFCYIS